jgi:fructose-1,6-bisphosphatase I
MAFVIHAMGGASTNGDMSLLEAPVETLHQKTPVFIGEADKIAAIEAVKKRG